MVVIKRSILIFPAVQPAAPIASWRQAYDPLVDQIRPHITIGQVPVTQAAALAQQLSTPAQCFQAEITTISIEHSLPSGKSDEFAKICLEK
ncbi:hypothetical protein [Lactiplantibacillus fabifermentans]|uniref:2'-5' RNA ligase n=2 Tax=Lactiplantibacillus fabifermentans TaxID=483011 RepID=A0A0R2NSE1_9LACO|nr:hypothetical protein [Lactiplantibacillus fabifermentans]ETY72868.1 hypothetical protein LFAB_15375 [Lactiplantibacillus fabifermentans T30PCM01]KRO28596.1 hypothetical protein DY78_GL002250 [Lactiplantibacillus fabifermentans DSM 21115]